MTMARKFLGRKVTSESEYPLSYSSFSSVDHLNRYFGRAKDLPGVRELFQSRKNEEEEENQALAYYKKFMNQGPAYYGDLDENDGKLLEFEQQAEEEGMFVTVQQRPCSHKLPHRLGRGIFKSQKNSESSSRCANTQATSNRTSPGVPSPTAGDVYEAKDG